MQIVALILLIGACAGHTALLVFSINWWYAHAVPHRLLAALRALHGLLIVAGLIGFGWTFFDTFPIGADLSSGVPWRFVAGAYTLLCVVIGLGAVPWLTLYRGLRGQPGPLLSNHTLIVDVAARLGYKPLGRGRVRFLARLPGNQVFQVDFAERVLSIPRLPAEWNGLSILHVSDFHFIGSPDLEFFQHVMDCCRDWEPDLVAVTGDLVDTDQHYRWIVPVLGRLRWRLAAFAILGNHDSWRDVPVIRRRLGRLGMRVLANRWEQIEVRGRPLVVVGHEGPWIGPAPDMSGCPEGTFRLCLSHTPDNIRWAQKHDIDLMLAGHNHGGQIRFPVIGSVLVPSRYGRRYDCGIFHEPPTLLHVTRGLSGQHPLRYNCRPEVVKIVLKADERLFAQTSRGVIPQ
jgi:uncharacterized protein